MNKSDAFALVIPPTPFLWKKANKIPLGVCYIASNLEAQWVDLELVDLNEVTSIEEVNSVLDSIASRVQYIWFTGTSAHRWFLENVGLRISKTYTNVKTIIGWPIVQAEPNISDYFNLAISGQADSLTFDSIKNSTGLMIAPLLPKNLDEIIKPKREILLHRDADSLPIITSRYCPFKCTFCFNSTKDHSEAMKRHTVWRVMEEIFDCISLWYSHIDFQDDTFILSKKWILELCQEIERSWIQITFDCRARVWSVDTEVLLALKRAWCRSISYGIESGSQKILDIIGKKSSPILNTQALKLTKEVWIKTKAYFLIWVPGETIGTLEESMWWLEQNVQYMDKLYLYMWIPYPGSTLYNRKDVDFEIVRKTTDNGDDPLLWSALYRSANENFATIATPTLSASDLELYFHKIRNIYPDLTGFEW